ncbi:helix-turn-helix domain-containing protein [Microbacterium sp. Marseille-Q6648]
MRYAKMGVRAIAEQLGRSPSTIARELRRTGTRRAYRPFVGDG